MDSSDPPVGAPSGSFPLSDPIITLGDPEVESSSPTLPHINITNTADTGPVVFSSSDLPEVPPFPADLSATSHRPSRPTRKRGLGLFPNLEQSNKTPRIFRESIKTTRDLILDARDLIIQAYTITRSRDEQTKLLDLLEIFREYTEKGRLQSASSIIASQVANLETATRQIENKAKALAKAPTPPNNTPSETTTTTTRATSPSFASMATQGAARSTIPQEWTFVEKKNKAQAPKPARQASQNRLILIKSVASTNANFSSLATRNAFNKAFSDKGIKGPVVATVSKSLGQNLIVTTTSAFSADFLLEKQDIWQHIVPFRAAQKDEPWHKVALHGIPTADFNTPEGMALVVEEIQTFNKGLKPIGTPYWLTSVEKRSTQRAGSVAVAFATKEEADRAIRNRLYIAGISVRVEKLYSTAPTTQCQKCQGFGHLENHCKKGPFCKFCGDKHATQQHLCNSCQAKGRRCQHLAPKCANCREPHTADTKSCEVLLAIKHKDTTTQL
jgi:hypothetical protein